MCFIESGSISESKNIDNNLITKRALNIIHFTFEVQLCLKCLNLNDSSFGGWGLRTSSVILIHLHKFTISIAFDLSTILFVGWFENSGEDKIKYFSFSFQQWISHWLHTTFFYCNENETVCIPKVETINDHLRNNISERSSSEADVWHLSFWLLLRKPFIFLAFE